MTLAGISTYEIRHPTMHLLSTRVCAAVAVLATIALTTALAAAELKDAAVHAFTSHAEQAQQSFVGRTHLPVVDDPRLANALRSGEVVAGPGSGDGILTVAGGLVHNWRARVLIPRVTLEQVLRLSRSYPDYPAIFHPIVSAQVLSQDGDQFRVQMRMHEAAGGLSATLQARYAVTYTRLDPKHAFVVSRSEEIREVKNPNRPSESLLPEGDDNGYLWRARAMTRFVEDESGVWMEMETLGLSREFPAMLGWVIEPIARRIGRRSAEASLDEFKRAVIARAGR